MNKKVKQASAKIGDDIKGISHRMKVKARKYQFVQDRYVKGREQ